MARAGSGGGGRSGGGFRSSSGHSISRSSGGHRVGSSRPSSSFSSSRAGSSFSSPSRSNHKPTSSYRPPISPTPPRNTFGGGYSSPSRRTIVNAPIIRNTTVYNGGNSNPSYSKPNYSSSTPNYSNGNYRNTNESSTGAGCLIAFIAVVVVLAIIIGTMGLIGNSSTPASTVNREKLELGIGYNHDCIVDEIGWFDNIPATSRDLQYFFNKTGVQPYIVLRDFDSSLITEAEKEDFAETWYDENIDNEGTFMVMYFAEEDVDNDVGYMVYVQGLEVGPVMDAEAIDVFWSYLDSMWYSDMSTDELFIETFGKTADRIMQRTTTGADVGKYAVIFFGIAITGVIIIVIMKTKRKHDKEKAEETERILNTPLGNTALDDLADKYTNTD